MTRETKLGLGVGVSFLSLAAVVAYNTWRNGEVPGLPPEPTQQMAEANTNKVLPAPGKQPRDPGLITAGAKENAPPVTQPGTHTLPGSQGPGLKDNQNFPLAPEPFATQNFPNMPTPNQV